jgi:hypothetical protein
MTCQRSRAYTRLMRTLQDLAPAKLLPSEEARIRYTADSLLFCADIVRDAAARRAYADVERLGEHLVDTGRWTEERTLRLQDDVWACGPGLPSLHAMAA